MQPARELITFARGMFRDIWLQLTAQGEARREALKRDIQQTEQKIETLLERIVEANNQSVIEAYEKKIAQLGRKKLALCEKLESAGAPAHTFEEMFELSMRFLANPHKLWRSGRLEHRQTVIKLAFAEPPRYCRENGFSNPEKSMPFKLLEGICSEKFGMADRESVI